MITVSNLLTDIPADLPDELFQTILSAPNLLVERIISLGHASPDGCWLDQDRHEWVLLLQGAARLEFEGAASVELLPGVAIEIPAHQRHRIAWTAPHEPTIWLAIRHV